MRVGLVLGSVLALSTYGCGTGAAGQKEAADPSGGAASSLAVIDGPNGGSTSWVKQLGGAGGEQVIDVAAGGNGTTTVLTVVGDSMGALPEIGIVQLDRAGQVMWAWTLPFLPHEFMGSPHLGASRLGNAFLSVNPYSSGTASGRLVKIEPPGDVAWERPLPGPVTSDIAIDAAGGPLVSYDAGPGGPRLRKFRWDGTQMWDIASPATPTEALAFDPAGNVVVGGGLAFHRLDPQGSLLWSGSIAGSAEASGQMARVGATSMGTVVAITTYSGTVAWAGESARTWIGTQVAIAVTEASGTPRFLRTAHGADNFAVGAAVDPAGRVAVLVRGGPCGDMLSRWNLVGDELWEIQGGAGCDSGGYFVGTAVGIDPLSHDVLMAGWFSGAVHVVGVPLTSRGGLDGYVADVAP